MAPTALPPVYGVEMTPVTTAQDMLEAVLAALPETDALLMAAAVADYRPAQAAEQKIKKGAGDEGLTLALERTADILATVAQEPDGRRPAAVVGFAAETEDLLANAQAKLRAKRLDLMVANDVSAPDSGFEVETNRVVLLTPDGAEEALPLLSKSAVAERIVALRTERGGFAAISDLADVEGIGEQRLAALEQALVP